MAFTFDFGAQAINLAASPYGVVSCTIYDAAARRHSVSPFASRAGGVLMLTPPSPREVQLVISCEGSTASAFEANKDTLLKTLMRPRKRLVAGFQDSRFIIATLTGRPQWRAIESGFLEEVTVQFTSEDAYWSAPTPSSDVRTPTLALLPGETTAYGLQYSLTPGGTAPAPIRAVLINQSGGVTPTRWMLSNLSAIPPQRMTTTASVPAGSVLVVDGDRQLVWVSAMTNVIGWWPLEDASGSALDFSGNSRDLSTNGTVTYAVDGVVGAAATFDGTTGFFDSASAGFNLTGNISLVAWVKTIVNGLDFGIMGKAETNKGYSLRRTSGNVFTATIGNSTTTRTAASVTTTVASNWYHIALTFTQATGVLSIYINGRLEAQTAGGAFTPSVAANNFRVGSVHNLSAGTAEFWPGQIDEPAVLNVALTAAQVFAIYTDSLPAYNGTKQAWVGQMPPLDPTIGTTNLVELRCDHATTAATPRAAYSWRSRYE